MKEHKKQKKQEQEQCERAYFNKIEVDEFDIIITVDMQDKKHATISVEVADQGIKESETYHNVNQMQDICFLIDRMTMGVIKQIHEKKEQLNVKRE